MEDVKVTIVVVPRDHFSDTRESLESIYAHADLAFALVYVDGGSPRRIAGYLQRQADSRDFRLIRTNHYLSPNRARNLGAEGVETPYIVFIDNDVIVAPNWLSPLVECAEQTGAAVVGPLIYEQRPLHTIVHFAGGEARIETTVVDSRAERHLIEKIFKKNIPSTSEPTGCAEFHCMLVRTEAFQSVGGLDEHMLSTRENIDFCMAIKDSGGAIYLEPTSKITYLEPSSLKFSDVPYFALRWSDDWDLSSLHHLRDKWELTEDRYFTFQYRNLGWRRRGLMMQGCLLRWLLSWRLRIIAERALRPLEKRVNKLVSRRHAREHSIKLRV